MWVRWRVSKDVYTQEHFLLHIFFHRDKRKECFYSCRYRLCFLLQASRGSHGGSPDTSRNSPQPCCADKHIGREPINRQTFLSFGRMWCAVTLQQMSYEAGPVPTGSVLIWAVPCRSGWRRRLAPGPQACTGWRARCRSSCLAPPCCKERSNICPQGSCVFVPAACRPEWRGAWSSRGYLSPWSDLQCDTS